MSLILPQGDLFPEICLLRFLIDRFVGFARRWLVRFVNMIYWLRFVLLIVVCQHYSLIGLLVLPEGGW